MIRHLSRFKLVRSGCRTYLSPSFQCQTAWSDRLASSILQNVNVEQFYAEVEAKHQQNKNISAIDVDIFVNRVTGDGYLEEMADMVHKLRMTEEATQLLESTPHAVVRNFLEHDQLDLLLHVLRDPLNYGVFLDTFSANLLLDKLVEEKKFTAAAEVASFLMLQEDFGNDITKSLSLLAGYKYLESPEPFIKPEPAPEPVKNAAPTPAKGKKAKKEENRVRVKFLRNEFFDDHFDIRDSRHLVGKTLVRLSPELPQKYQASVKLLGLCLYQKYPELIEFVGKLGKEEGIFKEVSQKAEKLLEESVSESEDYKLALEKIKSIADKATLIEDNFESEVVGYIKSSIEKLEKSSIAEQQQTYQQWLTVRDERLQDELLRLKRAAAIKEFERTSKDLEMEEKKLWFFENEDQIDLEIDSKVVRYPKRWFGKKKKPRVIDEGYIPPEIEVHRSSNRKN